MRIVFMGTPDFALETLKALEATEHEIIAVYSQPPRAKGRGHKIQLTPVHAYAQKQGWPVFTPKNFKDKKDTTLFEEHNADIAVVVAYGLLLPKIVLDAPTRGCINVHASLLPRWRGAAPIQRAIEAGDTLSGISIMQMREGLDTGPIILQETVKLQADTTAFMLHNTLAEAGARLCVKALALPTWTTSAQSKEGITYAHKLNKSESALDFNQSATVLECKIRAFTPFPSATVTLFGEKIKVLAAKVERFNTEKKRIGSCLDNTLLIGCAKDALRLEILQRPGRKVMRAEDFLRGHAVPAGTRLE